MPYNREDTSDLITTMWTRCITNDDDFMRLYDIPDRHKLIYEIERLKDLVIDTFRVSNKIEEIVLALIDADKGAEMTLKLSINSAVYFLKDWNIIKNKRVSE